MVSVLLVGWEIASRAERGREGSSGMGFGRGRGKKEVNTTFALTWLDYNHFKDTDHFHTCSCVFSLILPNRLPSTYQALNKCSQNWLRRLFISTP